MLLLPNLLYHTFIQAHQVCFVLLSSVPLSLNLSCEYNVFQALFPHNLPDVPDRSLFLPPVIAILSRFWGRSYLSEIFGPNSCKVKAMESRTFQRGIRKKTCSQHLQRQEFHLKYGPVFINLFFYYSECICRIIKIGAYLAIFQGALVRPCAQVEKAMGLTQSS